MVMGICGVNQVFQTVAQLRSTLANEIGSTIYAQPPFLSVVVGTVAQKVLKAVSWNGKLSDQLLCTDVT